MCSPESTTGLHPSLLISTPTHLDEVVIGAAIGSEDDMTSARWPLIDANLTRLAERNEDMKVMVNMPIGNPDFTHEEVIVAAVAARLPQTWARVTIQVIFYR